MGSEQRLDHRTVKQLERFLTRMRVELEQSVRRVMSQCGAPEVGSSSDPAAAATETLNGEIQAALVDRHSHQVAQIEAALERLRRAEYGVCRDCGEFIGRRRLQALPFAPRCCPCQARSEREARAAGGRVDQAPSRLTIAVT